MDCWWSCSEIWCEIVSLASDNLSCKCFCSFSMSASVLIKLSLSWYALCNLRLIFDTSTIINTREIKWIQFAHIQTYDLVVFPWLTLVVVVTLSLKWRSPPMVICDHFYYTIIITTIINSNLNCEINRPFDKNRNIRPFQLICPTKLDFAWPCAENGRKMANGMCSPLRPDQLRKY